jgi:heterodisulfide reductase subunit A
VEAKDMLGPLVKDVKGNKNIELLTKTSLKDVKGYVGNFKATLDVAGKEEEIEVGAIVVSTGASPFIPEGMHGYGDYENVVTQSELEELIKEGKVKAKNITMIQCVGAREKDGRPYCSRICCMVAIKNALHLKEMLPDASVRILNRDIMAVGKTHEDYYRKARELGVNFIKYDEERPPNVIEKKGGLKVEVYNESLGRDMALESDLVVLSTPLVPKEDNKKISRMLKVPLDQNGFFLEAHAKLNPVDFATSGVYLCGTAHSPKDVEDSVSQALGAASRATTLLSRARIKTEATTSLVIPEKCIGCDNCEFVCPYGAIKVETSDNISRSNPALCKGCGSCAVECPANAITMQNFTDGQIKAMIDTALEDIPEDEPKIISFLCNWCAYAGSDLAGVSRLQYPPNTRTIRLMCTGRVDPLFIYHALLKGADGVLVGGCHIGDCHYISGNQNAEKRMKRAKKQIVEAGLEPERLRLEWVSASEGQRFAEVVTEFTEELKKMGPNPLRKR